VLKRGVPLWKEVSRVTLRLHVPHLQTSSSTCNRAAAHVTEVIERHAAASQGRGRAETRQRKSSI
jgi:hypothetical protein